MSRVIVTNFLTLDGVMQAPPALRLVDSTTTTTGVIVATYEPA